MLTGGGMGMADGGDWIAAVLTAQGGKRGIGGKRGAATGGIGRKEGDDWGFMLYGGLIWGMWGAQGVYMAG